MEGSGRVRLTLAALRKLEARPDAAKALTH